MALLLNTNPHLPFVPVSGQGAWLQDEAGRKCLDMVSGTWAAILGHSHPEFAKRVAAQLATLAHLPSYLVSDGVVDAAKRLSATLPGNLDRVVLLNTGSEAVDFAVKMARIATGKPGVAGIEHGYFGATGVTLSLSEAGRSQSYLPTSGVMPPIPFPSCRRCELDEVDCGFRCLDQWEQTAGEAPDLAAVLVEPVLVSAGVLIPPAGFLRRVQQAVRRLGCLLIVDEVTTGVGRTGRWYGSELDGIEPDIVALGKAIGNGLPVAAVVATPEVEGRCGGKLLHVQSHQNDPLSAAIVEAVLDVICSEGLVARAAVIGQTLQVELTRLQRSHPVIREVRCIGTLAAIELGISAEQGQNLNLQQLLLEQGVLMDYRARPATLRMLPPYVVDGADLNVCFDALDRLLDVVEACV